MRSETVLRIGIPDGEALTRLSAAALPLGLRASDPQRLFHRDLYLDTPDGVLERRGVTCRLRIPSEGERTLTVKIRGAGGQGDAAVAGNLFSAVVSGVLPEQLFEQLTEPVRVLRAIIDPERLSPRVELETDRIIRIGCHRWLFRPQFEFRYDAVTTRAGEFVGPFHELTIRRLRQGGPGMEALAKAFRERHGIHPVLGDKLDRARVLLNALEVDVLERAAQSGCEIAVIPFDFGRVGMHFDGGVLKVLCGPGGGEEAVRAVLRTWFGSVQGQLRLLGTAAATGNRPAMEVWLARRIPLGRDGSRPLEWLFLDDTIALVGSPSVRDTRTLAALHVAARSDLMRERPVWALRQPIPQSVSMDLSDELPSPDLRSSAITEPVLPASALDVSRPHPEQFINRDLSQLAFTTRILELAEDRLVPLLERVRFLSIFSATMDEVFMVRVGVLKRAVSEGRVRRSIDGLTAGERLDAVAIRSRRLVERAYGCLSDSLMPALAAKGIRILGWTDLDENQRVHFERLFAERVFPVLTPLAASPSHPFPHIANFATALAVMVRHPDTAVEHFAAVPVPTTLLRFLQVPECRHFVPIEVVMAANIEALFPGLEVIGAHWFRVTRSGEVRVDEWSSQDLLQAIEEEVEKRPFGAVTRVEVEAAMPQAMRELLLQEFQFEESDHVSTLGEADIYQVESLPDLGGLSEIARLEGAELHYPPLFAANPVDRTRPFLDAIRDGDILLHFPYDSFESTVERFFVEAADDPDVLAIKVALYRTNPDSRIVNALQQAAARGKQVVALVELKARFEEERNIEWAKALEAAGVHVVYGLLGLKTHCKIALVVRREGGTMHRYVYLGSGNLNALTAKSYTDLGFFSADPEIGADVNDLFNAITGYAAPTEYRRLLIAPVTMFQRFVELIERESEHARAGRRGRIRAKMNGLGDPEIIAALYRASQAGVHIDLMVRGVCTLRPCVRGLSERIRVVSVLGRFLEHGRIFHFGNAGNDEYFMGSADWRTRNLSRRIEVVTPVSDRQCQKRLSEILDVQLNDSLAWDLCADESYVRRTMQGVGSQEQLIALSLLPSSTQQPP